MPQLDDVSVMRDSETNSVILDRLKTIHPKTKLLSLSLIQQHSSQASWLVGSIRTVRLHGMSATVCKLLFPAHLYIAGTCVYATLPSFRPGRLVQLKERPGNAYGGRDVVAKDHLILIGETACRAQE